MLASLDFYFQTLKNTFMNMKTLLTLGLYLLFGLSGYAQVTAYDYEEGIAFLVGETGFIDVNYDGIDDLQVTNLTSNSLTITPISFAACIAQSENSFPGNSVTETYSIGDIVDMDLPSGGYNDFDDSKLINTDGTLAEGWVDNEETFIGFMDFGNFSFGWLQMRIDMSTQTLYLHAQGFEATESTEIIIGDFGIAESIFDFELFENEVTFENSSFNSNEYLWDFGNGMTSSEKNPTYTYVSSGFYNVCLTAINPTNDVTTCKTVNAVVNGIEDIVHESIDLYPNPTQQASQIRFELNKAQEITISIYDVIGAQVALLDTENYSEGQHTVELPVSGLEAGQYFVNLSQENEVLKVLKLQKVD